MAFGMASQIFLFLIAMFVNQFFHFIISLNGPELVYSQIATYEDGKKFIVDR